MMAAQTQGWPSAPLVVSPDAQKDFRFVGTARHCTPLRAFDWIFARQMTRLRIADPVPIY
jgi:hypothetical protein